MPRKYRLIAPDVPYHIIKRGHTREAVFFTQEDYPVYLNIFEKGLQDYECKCHCYTLMPNHIHAILSTSKPTHFARLFQSIDARYVHYINKTYKRTGTLWDKRFQSFLIDSIDYFETCKNYIENNPVEANLTRHPKHYPWTSYHHKKTTFDTMISELSVHLPHEF